LRVALRRQTRRAGSALLGGRGSGLSVSVWLCLLATLGLAYVVGGPFLMAWLLTVLGVAIRLTFAGAQSRLAKYLLAGSALTGVGAAAYVWWVLGEQIDAANSFTPAPAAAGHGGLALVVLGASSVVFIATAITCYVKRPT